MYPTVRISIQAFILMLIFLGSFAVREGHFLLAHTHHHERCITSEGQFHFHGEEFAPENCDICAVQALTSELPPCLLEVLLPKTKIRFAVADRHTTAPTSSKIDRPNLRGPPRV